MFAAVLRKARGNLSGQTLSSATSISCSSHAGTQKQPSLHKTPISIRKKSSTALAPASASDAFHPGQHQMLLTSVHPPIPPPREISALTSPMLCDAPFCSAESLSCVAARCYPRGVLGRREGRILSRKGGVQRPWCTSPHSFTSPSSKRRLLYSH